MSIFKCKMCGGTIEFEPGASVGVCDSCGTKQTLPRLDDDRRANLYDRANHFRRNNEFDKAAGIYEQILNEDTTDAEAYWSLVLCRYGIEYVEDPATRKRVPTVNRAQFTSIFDDDNYRSALEHADAYQRMIYEDEANAINEIQKGILAISQKEEPFDVFICYKETDNNGRRTPDSVLANDLYHQLTQEGFKVFFARITLEDKLGTAYEPYIFAALNSAKVMVALGTRPEYFNAVWVKNEWSRYLALVKQSGGKKMLIPAYKDMDPYDLPDEFSHLQAQDMSKLGFMQDLIRGIKKIAKQDEPKAQTVKETVVVQESGNANTRALVKRGNQALEDREWENAEDFFNRALDLDAECAEAFMGKFLASQKVVKMEDLVSAGEPRLKMETVTCLKPDYVKINELTEKYAIKKYFEPKIIKNILYYYNFSYSSGYESAEREAKARSMLFTDKNYLRAVKYAGADYKAKLIKLQTDDDQYWEKVMEDCEEHDNAEKQRLKDEYEAFLVEKEKSLAEQHEMAEKKRRADYDKAVKAMQEAKTPSDYFRAAMKFSDIGDLSYLDCKNRIADCNAIQKKLLDEIAEAERKRKTKSALIVASIIAFVVAAFLLVTLVIIPSIKYNAAVKLYEDGEYMQAITAFTALDGYKDSEDKAEEAKYAWAESLLAEGTYATAIEKFEELGDYKDSADKAAECWFLMQKAGLTNVSIGSTIRFGYYEQDNNTSNGKEEIEWIVLAVDGDKALIISQYALDCQRYNSTYTDTTWKKCSLRTWLNGTFYNAAFGAYHQEMIISTTVSADKNPYYSTSPGNSTTDQVFLLSITEANKYFSSDEARQCQGTAYCYAQGAHKASNGNCWWWWLRSPGSDSVHAAGIDSGGSVDYGGFGVNYRAVAIRPAMWIDIGS